MNIKKLIIFLTLFALIFTSCGIVSKQLPSLVPYRVGDKWGYCDTNKKTVAIRTGEEGIVKLLIVDASGNPIKNKPIGRYKAITDSRGIVTLKVKGIDEYTLGSFVVNGQEGVGIFYGDLLAGVYDFATFGRNGYIISTSLQSLKPLKGKKIDIRYEGDNIYIPYELIGAFGINGGKTKIFNNNIYVAVNTIVPAFDTAIIITDETIEFLKLKEVFP